MRIRSRWTVPVIGIVVPLPSFLLLLEHPLLLLLAHAERHHAPGEIFHAMLVRQLQLGFGEELPYLGGQRVVLLHLVDALVGKGGVVLEGREKGGAEKGAVGDLVRFGGVGIEVIEDIAGGGCANMGVGVGLDLAALSRMHVAVGIAGKPSVRPSREAEIVLCYCWVHGV